MAIAAILLGFQSTMFMACGSRTEGAKTDVDTTLYETTGETEVERDEVFELPTEEIDFGGRHYVVRVRRAPSDSLPKVKDSYGDPYLDNEVFVTVTADGSTIVKRSITKADFAGVAAGLELSKLVLGGMTFSGINSSGLHFCAQINSPGSVEGGNNFILTFPLSGSGLQIVADESGDDMSSNDD